MRKRVLFAAAVVLLFIAAAAVMTSLHDTYRGFSGDVFLTIDRGTPTAEIGRQLANAGVIRSPWQFWLERALHRGGKVQAGEYEFQDPASVATVFDRLVRGDVYYFEFTVKEGSNIFDIAQSLETAAVMPGAKFLQVAGDPALIRDLDPAAPSLEGYLFPSTYRLSHATTARDLCKEMTEQFRKQWRKLAGAGKTTAVHQAVTLASMVEKETGVPGERALIAGVFVNRLRIGMKLGCDPTTIYAALLDKRFRGGIYKSDLASQNPYNTYQHAGLPPGPIANPGADALQSALQPAQTDYLYFVAKAGGGGHNFSSTLAAHDRATHAYRRGRKAD
jgi:UPF0755 protein